MADSAITVKVVREVNIVDLVSDPLRRYFDTCLILSFLEASEPGNVPIDTGYLRASLQPGSGYSHVDPQDPPEFAIFGTDATEYGVSYPTVLEESDRTHYASGPSWGAPTKGWLHLAILNVELGSGYKGALRRLSQEIKNYWMRA